MSEDGSSLRTFNAGLPMQRCHVSAMLEALAACAAVAYIESLPVLQASPNPAPSLATSIIRPATTDDRFCYDARRRAAALAGRGTMRTPAAALCVALLALAQHVAPVAALTRQAVLCSVQPSRIRGLLPS